MDSFKMILGLAEAGQIRQAVVRINEEMNTPDLPLNLQAKLLELSGRCLSGYLKKAEAIHAFLAAADLYQQAGDSVSAHCCSLMSIRHSIDKRHFQIARDQAQEAMLAAERLESDDLTSLACEFNGIICLHERDFAAALTHLRRAQDLGNQRKLSWEHNQLLSSLAMSLFATGDKQAAREIIHDVQVSIAALDVPWLTSLLTMNVAYMNWMACDFEGCRTNYQQILNQMPDDQGSVKEWAWLRAMASYNLGLVEMQVGNLPQAEELLNQAWSTNRRLGYLESALACNSSLIIAQLMLRNAPLALQLAKTCRQSLTDTEGIESVLAPYYIALAYLASGNLTEAKNNWDSRQPLSPQMDIERISEWVVNILQLIQEGEFKSATAASFIETAQGWESSVKEQCQRLSDN